ncbi:uncharacterized protein LOC141591215 [Silene latifolia]|uniref:uncharacterized protein LOC141591215 n=1 Tax=Silene latifolia TaxID=37657 RepID=UPI003D77072E
MSTSEADQAQALLQPQKDDVECRTETQETKVVTKFTANWHVIHYFKLVKTFDIMKSALKIFASNTKLMFLMLFSIIPLYVFMVFYEIKLQKVIVAAPGAFSDPYRITTVYLGDESRSLDQVIKIHNDTDGMEYLFDVFLLYLLYLVIYPLLELLSMTITIQIAARVYTGEEPPATLKEVFCGKINSRGVLITYGYVHLLSSLTLLGLISVVVTHLIFTRNYQSPFGDFQSLGIGDCLCLLLLGIHIMIFVALLYKYVDWSAFWNMTMVISVLEDESGLDAFGMTVHYGKHCNLTGLQLMLGFTGFSTLPRLLCVYSGLRKWNLAGVTCIEIGLICLGNLVKWVIFMLFYFDCKQQTMEKKNDDEIGKAANVG